ncbi:MAG: cellulase family glycosylhydrolase [Spirochaetota bacterium]
MKKAVSSRLPGSIFIIVFVLCAALTADTVLFSERFTNENSVRERWHGKSGSAAFDACSFLPEGGLKITRTNQDIPALIDTEIPPGMVHKKAIVVSARIRGENITKINPAYTGSRFLFQLFRSGAASYLHTTIPSGTFGWTNISFYGEMQGEQCDKIIFRIGLDQALGTIVFDRIEIRVIETFSTDQAAGFAGAANEKGHDLPALRGVMMFDPITEENVKTLSEWNVNCIRWNIGGWDHDVFPDGLHSKDFDAIFNKEIEKIDTLISLAKKYGMYVVLDMMGASQYGLFSSASSQARFIDCWKRLAARYKDSDVVSGYDLANEPMNDWREGVMRWNELTIATAKAIRTIDPATTIIIEGAVGGNPIGFISLKPLPMSNIVYSPHMYQPVDITHQGILGYKVGAVYPGTVGGVYWDKAALEKALLPVIEFQKRYGVHMFVGEFSCIRWAPDGSAARYIADCIDIFEKYNWDWAYHAFRSWHGWDAECPEDMNVKDRSSTMTESGKVIRSWFAKNKRPGWYKK